MRSVQTNIKNLGLKTGDKVQLKLLDLIGRPTSHLQDGAIISYDEDIALSSEIFSLELWENENSKSKTYYQLTIKGINYNFTVPKGEGIHDLMALFQLGSNDEVSYVLRDVTYFEEDFIEKIQRYFNQKEPNFTKNQQRAFNQFIYYADFVHGTDLKIDLMEKLDMFLGGIYE